MRVATVQFQQRMISSFEEFMSNIEYFVDVVSDYRCDFVIVPGAFHPAIAGPGEAETTARRGDRGPDQLYAAFHRGNAQARDRAITSTSSAAPTRPATEDGEVQNVAYVFLRDGSVHAQEKIHPTPNERYWWNIQGGDQVATIRTDCGPIGVLICYDAEFPELARRLVDEGARLLFIPFCTDNRQSYLRVRYCGQARAVENQCYVIMAGNVGNLPNVENMDIQYAESCILTPCDFPFARDGIAAESSENVETVGVADLDMTDLSWAQGAGDGQEPPGPPVRPLPAGLDGR